VLVACAWAALSAHAAPSSALASPASAAEEWVYVIEKGDTLLALKARWLRPEARWQALQKLNRIADPRRLTPGAPLRIPVAMLREEPAQVEVQHVHGEVWFERGTGPRQPLQAATVLLGGDTVITGKQSSASVRFAGGARTLIGPETRFRLERLSRLGPAGTADSQLRLDSGSLETRVPAAKPPSRMQIRTPTANLGVRGTEFRSRVDGTRSWLEVLEGRVSADAQPVNAGFGILATASGVGTPRALPTPPDLAALPDRIERLPLQLPLVAPAGAARLRAQVFAADQPDQLLLEGLFDQGVAQWLESPADGRYEVRIRAVDADGLEGLASRKAFTIRARPEPPFLLRPRAGEQLLQESVALSWSRNPEASTYRLQVSSNADFNPPLVERDGLSSTETQLPLLPGQQHWRMAAVRANGEQGPWSDVRVFERTDAPPPPPPPGAPAQLAPKASDDGLLLVWSASPLAGASYEVQVSRDPSFTDRVLDVKTERTEMILPRPEPGLYHVRVRTVSADGRRGEFGTVQTIEVPRSMWWLWLLPLLLLL
jgi:hypothetical protein